MCWCAQLIIQCETILLSMLWRFQIKSTLHLKKRRKKLVGTCVWLNSIYSILKYMRQEMFLVGWPHPKCSQGRLVRKWLRWLHQKWSKAGVVRTWLQWPHLKWPKALVVRATDDSGLPHSDGVLAPAHITLIPPGVLILKDDLRYRDWKMNLS